MLHCSCRLFCLGLPVLGLQACTPYWLSMDTPIKNRTHKEKVYAVRVKDLNPMSSTPVKQRWLWSPNAGEAETGGLCSTWLVPGQWDLIKVDCDPKNDMVLILWLLHACTCTCTHMNPVRPVMKKSPKETRNSVHIASLLWLPSDTRKRPLSYNDLLFLGFCNAISFKKQTNKKLP